MLNWKCAAILNAEGCQPPLDASTNSQAHNSNNGTPTPLTTKYYKRGTISNIDVPRH